MYASNDNKLVLNVEELTMIREIVASKMEDFAIQMAHYKSIDSSVFRASHESYVDCELLCIRLNMILGLDG